ncbi:ABC transporter permease [Schaalia odontolytica]|uniref:Acidobacterial duplicated orphan permease n=1 Tax=Schaalia odontolytica TaxID=1660 RepID=A0A2X0U6N3_9ACTO|nr:ABC transporter permease [Schaalia odontolytica]WMS27143.1 ABC transporter permease [Schaalia odontolytica]SPT55935.1 acidobacterial duplicated orphan permease [Schaalia odontolytica]
MLSLSALPWMNLRGYPVRTGTLIVFSMLMTMTIFGGTLVIQGIEHGLRTVQSRLGADIMVTPAQADTDFDAQTFLVSAEPSYFYMEAATREKVAAIDGVEAASSQLFLASARASCCSGRYQVIAYDPSTDFTIQPWMSDAVGRTQLGDNEVIVGANVLANDPNNFQLFDNTLTVVGQFDPTGSNLDNAVYMNFDTAKMVIDSSLRKGLNKYSTLETDNIISTVMVKVKAGHDAEAVAAQISQQVPGVSVATSTNLVSGIAQSLDATSRTVTVLIALAWAVGLLMITLVFVLMIQERRREFATLIAAGAHRRMISGIIIREALAVNLLGGAGGIVVSGVLLVSFSGLVREGLGGGFLVPSVPTMALLALGALASVGFVALVSSWIALRYVTRMDASLALKEGE